MRARFPQGRRARRLECPASLSSVGTILSEVGYHARIDDKAAGRTRWNERSMRQIHDGIFPIPTPTLTTMGDIN